jgi:hypothetical protein
MTRSTAILGLTRALVVAAFGATGLWAQGTSIITTVAGDGTPGLFGDGGPATKAELNEGPFVMAPDNHGNVYILDEQNNRVWKVTSGIANVVAGGILNFSLGDNGPATSAQLLSNTGVAVDNSGNLYIADTGHYRVRKVTAVAAVKTAAPSISKNGVVNGASFQPGLVSGSWATIQGSNLSSVTDTWAKSIVDGKLPDQLDGVYVTIGGAPAYIYYISPTQINLIVPPAYRSSRLEPRAGAGYGDQCGGNECGIHGHGELVCSGVFRLAR